MTPEQWAAFGQVAAALFTFVGVITSLYMSIQALREVRADRRLRQIPYLAFEPRGEQLPIEFVKGGKRIPGIDPAYVEEVFADLPEGAESIRTRKDSDGHLIFYGKLRNYGLGPAIHVHVTWISKEIWIGAERFHLDDTKLSEPRYSPVLNRIPATPEHILPGQASDFFRLPTFIEKDVEKKINQVSGILQIEGLDVFQQRHVTCQEFCLFTGYKDDPPHILITFGNIRESDAGVARNAKHQRQISGDKQSA